MVRHLLVTNDFPPKVGGIQSYLWELWRRLPPDEVTVLTTSFDGADLWDSQQPFRIVRAERKMLLPTPRLAAQVRDLAAEVGARLVLLDPALPLGHIGRGLGIPYGVVVHGAEVTVPGRTWPGKPLLSRVLRGAKLVVAAGPYPAAEAERASGSALPVVQVPPGVDIDRFSPSSAEQRQQVRGSLGIEDDALVVFSVSRLVPRKGMDTLIEAAHGLAVRFPSLVTVIAGSGRDRPRLEKLATGGPAKVRFLGRVPDEDLPGLHAAADVFAMLCRNRWMGLEQEGFGIVFLEAAACGVVQVAGRSGGAGDAVEHGVTGLVVDTRDGRRVVESLEKLLADQGLRERMGAAARARAETVFSYDRLAAVLGEAIDSAVAR